MTHCLNIIKCSVSVQTSVVAPYKWFLTVGFKEVPHIGFGYFSFKSFGFLPVPLLPLHLICWKNLGLLSVFCECIPMVSCNNMICPHVFPIDVNRSRELDSFSYLFLQNCLMDGDTYYHQETVSSFSLCDIRGYWWSPGFVLYLIC